MGLLRVTGILIVALAGCTQQPEHNAPDIDATALPDPFREIVQQAVSRIEADSRDAASWGQLGMALHALGNHQEAARHYDRAERLDPQAFDWAYLHGVTRAELGDDDAAASRYRRAVRIDPDYVPAKLALARLLANQGKLQQARRLFSELVLEVSDVPQVYFEFGVLLNKLDEIGKSIDMLQRAIRIEPRYAAAHYALAGVYAGDGEHDRAEQHRQLFETFGRDERPVDDPVLERVSALNTSDSGLMNLGLSRLRRGAFDDAIDAFEALAERGSDDPSVYSNLIGLNGQLRRVETAEAAFAKGLERIGADAALYQNLGILYMNARRYDDAEQAFRRAVELDPAAAASWAGLGGALASTRRPEEAGRAYEKALSLDPEDQRTHWLLGRLLLEQNKPSDAVTHLEAATNKPGTATARYRIDLSTAYRQSGRANDAVKALNDARQLADALGQQGLIVQIDGMLADGVTAP